ncbi:hypothetical protein AURDEDRAFT_178003 [Auricularia subglabra TFB-10046 SS5]|uniref:Uncharacterized protein n=1 Tax=Auricularia subglabra (strain TFB-10046 / SS5) TaxID=717982 RepID=J0WKS2_AURST|nr:hypothetical protein AURDEDRAFT_178003 [Auricularia subglabra TFB-10046 SS5]
MSRDTVATIPKPTGQVSRIKRGGYKLQSVLQWDDAQYSHGIVRNLAESHLDMSVSYAKQDPVKIDLVCEKACEEVENLKAYQEVWPVRDFLKNLLQKSAQKEKAKAVVGGWKRVGPSDIRSFSYLYLRATPQTTYRNRWHCSRPRCGALRAYSLHHTPTNLGVQLHVPYSRRRGLFFGPEEKRDHTKIYVDRVLIVEAIPDSDDPLLCVPPAAQRKPDVSRNIRQKIEPEAVPVTKPAQALSDQVARRTRTPIVYKPICYPTTLSTSRESPFPDAFNDYF